MDPVDGVLVDFFGDEPESLELEVELESPEVLEPLDEDSDPELPPESPDPDAAAVLGLEPDRLSVL